MLRQDAPTTGRPITNGRIVLNLVLEVDLLGTFLTPYFPLIFFSKRVFYFPAYPF